MNKLLIFTFFIIFSIQSSGQASNACSGANTINSSVGTCSNISGNVYGASRDGSNTTCRGTVKYDVWYKFIAQSASPTITLSGVGGNFKTPGLQVLTGCGGTEIACGASPLATSGLNIGTTYYIRIYSTSMSGAPSTNGGFTLCISDPAPVDGEGSRMKEIFRQSLLSPPNVLNDPWEIIYGPDGYLWITESRGYKVYRMNPSTGQKTMILDISKGSSFLSDPSFDLQFDFNGQGNPQGGLAGMAIHPEFNSGKKFVYISYIHKYVTTVAGNAGVIFRNQLVKFTYDAGTNKLGSPETLCDTLPGSSDHNSQRIIIAPVGNTNYLFYAQGDMGAGQFANAYRPNHAQDTASYEGKILRFNLESDGGSGLNKWIPNDNPFNNFRSSGRESAVWVTGIRNNQGFAYAKINGVPYLYGSSHGPFSDDEINIIERSKNYGHPRVIGFSNDHNYDAAKAGGLASALPLIYNETKYASDTIGAGYGDPIYCFYAPEKGSKTTTNTIQYIYNQVNLNNNDNSGWPSLAPSGMELYSNSLIPGWKNSLLLGSLKGGRVIRLKLKADGSGIVSPGTATDKVDTINYFRSINRFRDVAISPDGKTIFTVIDKSSTTSGPTTTNPINSACAGCVQKFTFLGYGVNTGSGNRSNIPKTIDVAAGRTGLFETANKIVINAANGNTNVWVPITDTNSNIVAEIYARGHDLDTVTTSLYSITGVSRINLSKKYLNRNLTITPQKQPGDTVRIRLYISKAEYDAFVSDGFSSGISGLKIFKNGDSCKTAITKPTVSVKTTVAELFNGTGYVLQGDITGFSSFYFSEQLITLPLNLLSFKGALQDNSTLLQWQTTNEINTSYFVVERSLDGATYSEIGTVMASGNTTSAFDYSYRDNEATSQASNILYYRLRMVDKDTKYTYSNTITITLPYVAGKVVVTPNPFMGEVKVTIAAAVGGKAQWKLIDNSGHVVMQGSEHVRMGNNQLQINTTKLAAGAYYLDVSGAGVSQQVKIQKQ